MHFNDHPPPHFHARQQAEEVTIGIRTKVVAGMMSAGALRILLDWADRHEAELLENWNLARDRKPLKPIPGD
jgi:hypothetical protein